MAKIAGGVILAKNAAKKILNSFPEYDIKEVIKWEQPDEQDLRCLITMCNIPKMLHGKGCQPRTIYPPSTWDRMRKACYAKAGFKCEVCGARVGEEIEKRQLHAHEIMFVNWRLGEVKFVRCVAECYTCHILCTHTGRALTLYKRGNSLFNAETLLAGAEHAFKLVHAYNTDHADRQPIRVYGNWLEYLRQPELEKPMRELIEKYDIKFYIENTNRMAKWGEWYLLLDGKKYPTPYANEKEWKKAMENASKSDSLRQVKNNFTGELYDKLDEIIKNS